MLDQCVGCGCERERARNFAIRSKMVAAATQPRSGPERLRQAPIVAYGAGCDRAAMRWHPTCTGRREHVRSCSRAFRHFGA